MNPTFEERKKLYSFDSLLTTYTDGLPIYVNDTYKKLPKKYKKQDLIYDLTTAYNKKHQLNDYDINIYNFIINNIGINIPFTTHNLFILIKDKLDKSITKNKLRKILNKLQGWVSGEFSSLLYRKHRMYFKPFISELTDEEIESLVNTNNLMKRSNNIIKHSNITECSKENVYMITDCDLKYFNHIVNNN